MKKHLSASIAIIFTFLINLLDANEAVLIRIDGEEQRIRVEAQENGNWIPVASGYRSNADNGWLKVAIPEEYTGYELKVYASDTLGPFGIVPSHKTIVGDSIVDYPSTPTFFGTEDGVDSRAEISEDQIEESDIWAWEDEVLYFYNQYRGLQILDMSDRADPEWIAQYRLPLQGEELYSSGEGEILLLTNGNYWSDDGVNVHVLNHTGNTVELEGVVSMDGGHYMDSRKIGDHLYVLTREYESRFISELNSYRSVSKINLHTIHIDGVGSQKIDTQVFEATGWYDAVLSAQVDGILIGLNQWRFTAGNRGLSTEVIVLYPDENGIPEELGRVTLKGELRDKFKMNFVDGNLTTISQNRNWQTGRFSRNTYLENFNLSEGEFRKQGELLLAPGETLFATRFYGDTVYVVTFLRVDPLFAIDNTNRNQPLIAGELEVPGWSEYLEWVDGYLFAIGREGSAVTASIFDVSDPAEMKMTDRVFLSEDSWSSSEALYDEQAVSIYPEDNLMMLPFYTWSWKDPSKQIKAMQLISWDEKGELTLRGSIQHLDTPRRGLLKGDSVVTISGETVVATDVSDPDLPEEVSTTTVSWGIGDLYATGSYLLQIDGNYQPYRWYYWYDNNASTQSKVILTLKSEPNIPHSELELGEGTVIGSAFAGDRLWVILETVESVFSDNDEFEGFLHNTRIVCYDFSDPLNPELVGRIALDTEEASLGKLEGHDLGDGNVLWLSQVNDYYAFWDFHWSGYNHANAGFLITGVKDGISLLHQEKIEALGEWPSFSEWKLDDDTLLISATTYSDHLSEEGYTQYKQHSKLHAYDIGNPIDPLNFNTVDIPGMLSHARKISDSNSWYLYFNSSYRLNGEVWGWDEASAFEIFKFTLDEDHQDRIYHNIVGWVQNLLISDRRIYRESNDNEFYIEVFRHLDGEKEFSKTYMQQTEFSYYSLMDVKGSQFLLQNNQDILHFQYDFTGEVEFLGSLEVPFPNLLQAYWYSNSPAIIWESDGLYLGYANAGVDRIYFNDQPSNSDKGDFRKLSSSDEWYELDTSEWSLTESGLSDDGGKLVIKNWQYMADGVPRPDTTATDAGDAWYDSSWYGWYSLLESRTGWVYHLEHGNTYIYAGTGDSQSGMYFYDNYTGASWTNSDYYPWMYSYKDASWYYYLRDTGLNGNRWFYSPGNGWMSE